MSYHRSNSIKRDESSEIGVKEISGFVLRAWKAIALCGLSGAVLVLQQYLLNPVYTASVSILVQRGQNNSLQAISAKLSGLNADDAYSTERNLDRYILYFSSSSLYRKAVEELSRDPEYPQVREVYQSHLSKRRPRGGESQEQAEKAELAEILAKATRVVAGGHDVIKVSFSQPTPHFAAKFVNAIANGAIQEFMERDLADLDDAKAYLSSEIIKIEGGIDGLNLSILSLLRNSVFSKADQMGTSVDRSLEDLQKEITETKIESEQNKNFLSNLREKWAVDTKKSSTGGVSEKEASLIKIAEENQIRSLQGRNEMLESKMKALNEVLGEHLSKKNFIPKLEQSIQNLKRKSELQYQFLASVHLELLGVDIKRISLKNRARVLEYADERKADRASRLVPRLTLFTLLFAIFGGVCFFLYEIINPVVRGTSVLDGLDLTYLGSIPNFYKKTFQDWVIERRHKGKVPASRRPRLMSFKQITPESSAIKLIRTNLMNLKILKDQARKTIVVISPNPSEGKTTLAVNLAASIAQSGKSVLLIDCDFVHPAATTTFALQSDGGLSDVLLSGRFTMQDTAPFVRKIDQNLSVLPVGNNHGQTREFFSGDNFSRFLAQCKADYDYVLLDTPPVLVSADSISVISAADTILLCVAYGQTKIDNLLKACEKVSQISSAPFLYVMNRHDEPALDSYYYYPAEIKDAA